MHSLAHPPRSSKPYLFPLKVFHTLAAALPCQLIPNYAVALRTPYSTTPSPELGGRPPYLRCIAAHQQMPTALSPPLNEVVPANPTPFCPVPNPMPHSTPARPLTLVHSADARTPRFHDNPSKSDRPKLRYVPS